MKIKKNKEKKIQAFNLDHPLYQLQESSTDPKYLWHEQVCLQRKSLHPAPGE